MYTMEDRNYYSDHRVRARGKKWYSHFDQDKMIATVIFDNGEGEEVKRTVKCKFDVCETCNGKGSHVNPSIDCCGLSSDDFAEDPDFAEDYFSGTFDVPCYECGGQRVVPVVIPDLAPDWWEDFEQAREEDARWENYREY